MFLKHVEFPVNLGLNTSVCGQNWSLLFSVLYFLDPRPESDAHTHMAKALCIKNLQLNLLLAPFSFFFFFGGCYLLFKCGESQAKWCIALINYSLGLRNQLKPYLP